MTHLSVQCSKPGRAAVIRWTSMRDWHLRQRGRAAARCDRVDACGSSNRCLPWDAAGALSNSLSPMKCHWRSGDGLVCAAPGAGCWSILLSLRKLRGWRASTRFLEGIRRSRALTAIIGRDHAFLPFALGSYWGGLSSPPSHSRTLDCIGSFDIVDV